MDAAAAAAVVGQAIECGINFFDTADVYGKSQSEVMLGAALGSRRKDVVIATKFGLPIDQDPTHRGGSRRWIVEACDRSLRRLGTDYIDLYQQHGADPATPLDETLRALDDLVRAGKVRYVGASSYEPWRLVDADWTARELGASRFISVMSGLSLLERGARESYFPVCDRLGIGFLPYFPLAAGLLTGKYRRNEPPPASGRLTDWGQRGADALQDANLVKVEALHGFAAARDRELLELAISWLLAMPQVASVLSGATRPEQVVANVEAAEWKMSGADLQSFDELAASFA
ncbi:aldo/keto reductase [Sphingomonas sp. MG17]|uniref:Aldo/keto reductase n=2 Tax=Sphingomonas tagetis TaxID=2949092 RepID=A0A9X2KMH1_9SPHN|nr:aldo/keto reductase [Sphingomonas tagetis]